MAQVGLLEDNARIANLCATMLHYAGHTVTVYENSLDCLNTLMAPHAQIPILQSKQHSLENVLPSLPIDVLILDLHLPHINGIEVLRYLRAHPHTYYLPLIFCSAASPAEIACAMRVAPHAAFVEKPFKVQSLVDAITRVLQTPVN